MYFDVYVYISYIKKTLFKERNEKKPKPITSNEANKLTNQRQPNTPKFIQIM